MPIKLHQTHHTLADFGAIGESLRSISFGACPPTLHVFPEFFLCGYPIKDLCLHPPFIRRYKEFCQQIHQWALGLAPSPSRAIVGGPYYGREGVQNSLFELAPGLGLRPIYHKRILANQDVFDESRYFIPGPEGQRPWAFDGRPLLLQICEDLWGPIPSSKEGHEAIVNVSASPFDMSKSHQRQKRAMEVSSKSGLPVLYCNRVGGEDELLFDGGSFVAMGENILWEGLSFAPDEVSFTFDELQGGTKKPRARRPKGQALIFEAISFGIEQYASKCGFEKLLVAVSGGLDSSTLLALAQLALGQDFEVEAMFMPGPHTSPLSYDLAQGLCQNLSVPLSVFPIKFPFRALAHQIQETFAEEFSGARGYEGLQARLRGAMLYTRSNQTGALVLNTSNRSELSVGYTSLYGDSVGGLSPLGDLYKSELYQLAHFINKRYGPMIDQRILDRPPSAELLAHQKDTDSLPPYDELDPMLMEIFSSAPPGPENQKIYDLYQRAEHKRRQFGPILKLRPQSFGSGHRMPLAWAYLKL